MAQIVEDAPKPIRGSGTFGRLCEEWLKTNAFLSLKPSTRKGYRNNLLRMMCAEFSTFPVAEFEPKHIRAILAQFADRPASGNRWLRMFGILFRFAIERDMRQTDPTRDVRRLKEKADGARPWTEEEIAQFQSRWPVGSRPRTAIALLLHTGQRRSDVVKMGPGSIHDGMIAITQEKTGVSLLVPILPDLAEALAAVMHVKAYFLETQPGRKPSSDSLGNLMRDWTAQAGLPEGLSAHGLRKTSARRLAEAGCTPHQIAAITGHKTLSEVVRYTRSVDQKRLARQAMALLSAVKPGSGDCKTTAKNG
ncbi:tyrosine-type recombinase/integrase [Acetobacter musti]|nr:tyrosine-type recombinase/integrase [Acetobacter musti]